MKNLTGMGLVCAVGAAAIGCGAGEAYDLESYDDVDQVQQASKHKPFTVKSPDFEDGEPLPLEFTCAGNPFATGVSPKLKWKNEPKKTKSYAIVFRDTSIADPNFAFHWAIWNIPNDVHKLPDGIPGLIPGSSAVVPLPDNLAPAQHSQARGVPRFFGPCPAWQVTLNQQCGLPPVEPVTDSYEFTVYAMPEREIAVPAHDPAINTNYVDRLNALFDSMDLGTAVVTTTSNAVPSTVPFACPAP